VIRASSAEEALRGGFAWPRAAADVEITMTVPGAVEVIRELVKSMPQVLVGAGTVLNEGSVRQCADAGAHSCYAGIPMRRRWPQHENSIC